MTQTQREFEAAWDHAFAVYKPLLMRPEDGQNLVSLVSALKGFAWGMYAQGRTDARLVSLARSYATAQLKRGGKYAPIQ